MRKGEIKELREKNKELEIRLSSKEQIISVLMYLIERAFEKDNKK